MTKQEARNKMKQLRSELSAAVREEKGEQIRKNLLGLDVVKRSAFFYPFVSYGTEVDTHCLMKEVLAEGKKRMAVPKVIGEEMIFYEISSFEELEAGYRGILEPVSGSMTEARDGVMLLPGLAFDERGHRVGYGGGYYDKYLDKYGNDNLCKIAICYDFQIVDAIEADPHDYAPDIIVTERRILNISNEC